MTILTVIAVAGIAAIVSYAHMEALGIKLGESWRAKLIPFSVDGLIVAASMVLIDRRLRKLPPSPLAWGAVGVGVATSFIANAAHATTTGAMLWSAWPAVAFAGAFELLLQLFRDQAPVADKLAAAQSPPPTPTVSAELPAARYQPVVSPSPLPTPPSTPLPVVPSQPTPPRVPDASSGQPAPARSASRPASKPPAPSATTPKQQRTDSVVISITPKRAAAPRTSQLPKPTVGVPTATLAKVRAEVSRSKGRVGRRELAKRLGLSEHVARQALEAIRAEESNNSAAEGTKSRRSSRGTQS